MFNFKSLKIFDYPVFTSDIKEIDLGQRCVICTLNQYSFIIAEKDEKFKRALIDSDVLLPDGIGIVLAALVLKGKKVKKIAGADIHKYLLKKLNDSGGSCFYMGSTDKTLDMIRKHVEYEYPSLRTGAYAPPFKTEFTEDDNIAMVNAVNAFNPDVLFIGMTAPKQEKWAQQNKHKLDVKVICSIGAAFNFYAGTTRRPGKFWINLWMEWFARLVKQPVHLWKRYLVYGPVFLYKIFGEKLRMSGDKDKKQPADKIFDQGT